MADRDENGRYLPAHTQPGPGRTSKYHDDMPEQARKLAMLGMTDQQIAEFFEVSVSTMHAWMHKYPAFLEALNRGRSIADAEVAYSLYRRALGVTVTEERRVSKKNGDVETIEVTKELPPDTTAAAMWLGARQRHRWSKKEEAADRLNTIDEDGGRIDQMDDETLEARIRELEQRRAHDDEE